MPETVSTSNADIAEVEEVPTELANRFNQPGFSPKNNDINQITQHSSWDILGKAFQILIQPSILPPKYLAAWVSQSISHKNAQLAAITASVTAPPHFFEIIRQIHFQEVAKVENSPSAQAPQSQTFCNVVASSGRGTPLRLEMYKHVNNKNQHYKFNPDFKQITKVNYSKNFIEMVEEKFNNIHWQLCIKITKSILNLKQQASIYDNLMTQLNALLVECVSLITKLDNDVKLKYIFDVATQTKCRHNPQVMQQFMESADFQKQFIEHTLNRLTDENFLSQFLRDSHSKKLKNGAMEQFIKTKLATIRNINKLAKLKVKESYSNFFPQLCNSHSKNATKYLLKIYF